MRPALVVVMCACSSRAPIASCADDLRGTYLSDGKRWTVIETARNMFEAYPLFDDAPPSPLEVGPRIIELVRERGVVAGAVHRRFMSKRRACGSTSPVHVTGCANDTLELGTADPPAPIAFDPCTWGRLPDTHVEHWRRE